MESAPIRCLVNGQPVVIDDAETPTGLTVLDYVRGHLRATGTKEGCKEGDCGACVVLLGELEGDRVHYRPMTSCMVPVAEVAGRHLVTIEGLDVEGVGDGAAGEGQRGDGLNTAQREIVAAGASQCGFCTPGIVVSVVGHLLDEGPASDDAPGEGPGVRLDDEVDRALSGHLCRCTGYRSLRAATRATFGRLAEHRGAERLAAAGELPTYFLDVADRLRELDGARPGESAPRGLEPDRPWVAGGTDLYVQRGEALPAMGVVSLARGLDARPECRGVRLDGGTLRVGALTSFEELAQDPTFRDRVPEIPAFMDLVASWQVRTRSTVGGNVINASPIGDITILMLALGAVAVFEDVAAGGARRRVPLEDLYLGYKQLDRRPSEVLVEVRIPDVLPTDRVRFEKVSKRRWLDIASVNAAARLRVRGGVIEVARLAVGGVAPVPLFLRKASAALSGAAPTVENLAAALDVADGEMSPISDVRGAASYKRRLARHLLAAAVAELLPDDLDAAEVYGQVASA